jgi:hypothetical protein
MTIIVGPRILSATGGVITRTAGFTIHTFSTVGAASFLTQTTGLVEVLVVGGGGGSGQPDHGGGGGGSVLYLKNVPVLAGVSYPMSIGAGGPLRTPGTPTVYNYNGGNITAPGGGNGASPTGPAASNNPGGSGGGGAPGPAVEIGGTGANVIGLGFPGGNSPPAVLSAGGGGAGGAGNPGAAGGVGGIGLSYSISGTPTFYGGGGGGSAGGGTNPGPSSGNFGYGRSAGPNLSAPSGVVIIRYLS